MSLTSPKMFSRNPNQAESGGIFDRYLNFGNCKPEEASDAISGMPVQCVVRDVCAKCGDSMLKPSEASSSAVFRMSITSDWNETASLCDGRRTTPAYADHHIRPKRA